MPTAADYQRKAAAARAKGDEEAFAYFTAKAGGGEAPADSAAPAGGPKYDPNWQPTQRKNLKAGPLSGASDAVGESFIPGVDQSSVDNFLFGIGKSAADSGHTLKRGVYSLKNGLPWVSNEEIAQDTARLDAETEESRRVNESLEGTMAGQAGSLTGDIGQAVALSVLTGGVVNPAMTGAGNVLRAGNTAGKVFKNPLARAIVSDASAGGIQGALSDTLSTESKANNISQNAVLGGAFPVAGKIVQSGRGLAGKLASVASPRWGAVIAPSAHNAEEEAFKAATKSHERQVGQINQNYRAELSQAGQVARRQEQAINKQQQQAYKEEAAKLKEEAITSARATMDTAGKGHYMRATPPLVKALRDYSRSNRGYLDTNPDLKHAIDSLMTPGAKMEADVAAQVKSQVGAEARRLSGGNSGQLHRLERIFNDSILDSLPPDNARMFKEALQDYGLAVNNKIKPAPPTPVRLSPNVQRPTIPAAPARPTNGYKRTLKGQVMSAALRGPTIQKNQYDQER